MLIIDWQQQFEGTRVVQVKILSSKCIQPWNANHFLVWEYLVAEADMQCSGNVLWHYPLTHQRDIWKKAFIIELIGVGKERMNR